ncbi:MAG TPA: carbamoyltransferase HypF [Gammaproteobacteria bacterium]|nr:carbamoyltransferase HypF [Gammaproteobacteria bacterium]
MNHQAPHLQETGATALHLALGGRVQGVGFRPFVYRLALGLGLTGWVRNRTGQVEIHVQGERDALQTFMRRLFQDAPPLAQPELASCVPATPLAVEAFSIQASTAGGSSPICIPPDLYTCNDCLTELLDPADRRYRYPFINCTQCGPRYTLICGMPYDRPATTMAGFALCTRCAAEYRTPANRRYHAEPVACPQCGPTLEFVCGARPAVQDNAQALAAATGALRAGQVLAVKGIGGYHLVCDAGNDAAVQRLRDTKPRPHKPLAVMFPAPPDRPLAYVSTAARLTDTEADLLLSAQRPVVIVSKRSGNTLSDRIAPGLTDIGAMLPYSPLHHLLLNDFGAALVATSANISGEPVLTENAVVQQRLGHVADAFLHHNRPIARPADDPVYRVIQDRPRLLRPGRGCTPLEQQLPFRLERPLLAAGGHMKNTVALAWDDRIVISPHIGDMGSARSLDVFEQVVADLQALYQVRAEVILCDAHPGYATTRWAQRQALPVQRIFHHHAHAAVACPAATGDSPVLVFTWDGVGLGPDGTLWGGEALLGGPGRWQRFASLRPFHLPGGERAGREPWRSAAALCWESGLHWPGLPDEAALLHAAWTRRMNTPQTTAAGRLFDAAAALTGLCRDASFEGQGPMLLEAACEDDAQALELPLARDAQGVWITDWAPLLPLLLDSARTVAARSGIFHASLGAAIMQQARQARELHGVTRVGLSGGVFQNRKLTELVCRQLQADGFSADVPVLIPLNDAGLCYGQVIEFGFAAAQTG